jgi:hypothetical protein
VNQDRTYNNSYRLSNHNKNEQKSNMEYFIRWKILRRVTLTSSFVAWLPSILGLAFLASLGAVILERHSCLSGGGPPRGWPRIITLSPERIWGNITNR